MNFQRKVTKITVTSVKDVSREKFRLKKKRNGVGRGECNPIRVKSTGDGSSAGTTITELNLNQ